MMHNWFECKIRYEKIAENGMSKKVTEPIWLTHLALLKLNRVSLKKLLLSSAENLP